ncbi:MULTISPECIES: hypothetical protein [Amycolatopsis]|uniref:Uncharacterized protein n=1 Tax=Amycolatopsis albidoflavus TaxID=102226 RepID=A0ABW5I8Q6_9PSEU
MTTTSALASLRIPDPGGNPAAQRLTATAWHDLAGHLQEQSAHLTELSGRAGRAWQGGGADSFRAQAQALADKAAIGAHAASQVANTRDSHAEKHQQVLELLRQIGIEIAAMLGFWAAAAAVPPLLAAADAWLSALAVQGGRIVQLLARALADLVGFLVRSRAWIQEVMGLTWRTERFSLGYGRMITEGIRDAVLDVSSNSVTSAILGKKIDPGQLAKSAGLSFLVGGLIGGLEKSGTSRVLDNLGKVKRTPDGLPVFRSFSDQAKSAVNSLGRHNPATPVRAAPSEKALLFGELDESSRIARGLGLRGHAAEKAALEQELETLRSVQQRTIDRHTDAGRFSDDAAERAIALRNTVTDRAKAAKAAADDLRTAWVNGVDDVGLRSATRQHADALAALESASRQAAGGDRAAARARLAMRATEAETAAVQARVHTATDRLHSSVRWQEARDAVRQNTSVREQWSDAWERNVWRDGFATRKPVTETLLYDTPRYFVKGAATNAAKSAAEPGATPASVARRALIGGSTSALRGALNSFADNLVYPKSGIEETLWKLGLKGVDNFVSAKVNPTPNPPAIS